MRGVPAHQEGKIRERNRGMTSAARATRGVEAGALDAGFIAGVRRGFGGSLAMLAGRHLHIFRQPVPAKVTIAVGLFEESFLLFLTRLQ